MFSLDRISNFSKDIALINEKKENITYRQLLNYSDKISKNINKRSLIFILISISSFVFSQNWNTKGTVPMTFRVTVEPHMPSDEFMSIEFWKNGAVEEPPSNPTYLPRANRYACP